MSIKSFAIPLLIGIALGVVTTGVIVLARDDFYWYRNEYNANTAHTSVNAAFMENIKIT